MDISGRLPLERLGGRGAAHGKVAGWNKGKASWTWGPMALDAIVKTGAAAVASNLIVPGVRVPAATVLRAVYVVVGTAPTGSALTVVVKRLGVTLATVSVAATATSGSVSGLTTALAKGDMLTYDITAVGSTVAGSDVYVSAECYS